MKRLKISFDVDGVLLQCVEYAVELVNKEMKLVPPLSVSEFTEYNPTNERCSHVTPYYGDVNFVSSQPLYEGAQDMINWVLDQGHEVFFVTAVPPQCMSARANQLMELFPGVPATNIIMATRKELVRTDIHIDDAPHNIQRSKSHYPVLFRQLWNQDTEGVLSVNNYEQLKSLIDRISGNSTASHNKKNMILCLVGPTGSGKNEIQNLLQKNPLFEIPERYTTCPPTEGSSYKHISKEEFDSLLYRNDLFEYTNYGGHMYGMTENSIQKVLRRGKSAVITVDMAGANAIRAQFPDITTTVFIRRAKEDSIIDIFERNMAKEEKVRRLKSIEAELHNEELCDLVIINNDTPQVAVNQILNHIGR